MHGQLLTRRVFLAALVTMVALIHGESVAEGSQSHPRPDFGSAEGFRLECELLGGTFSADGIGNTNCHYPDGTWTQCDANGNDCWITPPARSRPTSEPIDLDDVELGEVATDIGGTSVVGPDVAGPTLAVDHDQKPSKAKHAKGKKRKK